MDSSDRLDFPYTDSHESVRRDHANELAEDYVEAIHQIELQGKPPRITDLQHVFKVSHVTVIRTIKRLEDKGLVIRSRKTGISLTESGSSLARKSAGRHRLVVALLRKLGVSEAQAQIDAEGLEHHFSEESLAAIQSFLEDSDP